MVRLRDSPAAERYVAEDEADFAGCCIVRAGALEERLAIACRLRSASLTGFVDRPGIGKGVEQVRGDEHQIRALLHAGVFRGRLC